MTATALSLSWTQSGSAVDSYTISYTYTIRRCGSGPISDSVEISNGDARSVMLDNLEEDSDYSITLTASGGLDSNVVMATTSTAGRCGQFLIAIILYNHCIQLPLTVHQVSMSMWTELQPASLCSGGRCHVRIVMERLQAM